MLRILLNIILTCLLSSALCWGQKSYTVSQWQRNLLAINPSYAGFNEYLVVSALHRSQWVGMEGAPTLQNLEVHSALKNDEIALGATLYHEKIGSGNYTDVFLNYAYRINLSTAKLAFGLKLGFTSAKRDIIKLRDNENDPAFDMENSSWLLPNFGVGLSYYNEKLFAGFSIPEFLGRKSNSNGKTQIEHNFKNYIYRISGGYNYQLNNDFIIQPVLLIDYSIPTGFQLNINVNGTYKRSFLGGLGFRSGEAIIIQFGYKINNQFSGLYSYDFNIGEIRGYSNGSHEIGLVYHFGYQVIASDPRDF